jgi:hypothetical protein
MRRTYGPWYGHYLSCRSLSRDIGLRNPWSQTPGADDELVGILLASESDPNEKGAISPMHRELTRHRYSSDYRSRWFGRSCAQGATSTARFGRPQSRRQSCVLSGPASHLSFLSAPRGSRASIPHVTHRAFHVQSRPQGRAGRQQDEKSARLHRRRTRTARTVQPQGQARLAEECRP